MRRSGARFRNFVLFLALPALSSCRTGGNMVTDGMNSAPLSQSDASLLYVAKAGDTMTGNLFAPGIAVGTTTTPPANGAIINGSLGIGTTSPSTNLHIVGAAYTDGNSNKYSLMVDPVGGLAAGGLGIGRNGAGTGAVIQTFTNAPLALLPNSGNVGIGIEAPLNPLSVSPVQYGAGTASQSLNTITGVGTTFTSAMVGSQFVFSDGTSAGTITAFGSATSLTVSTSQTVASQNYTINYNGLNVTVGGNVGIGTTAPGASLDVAGHVANSGTAATLGVCGTTPAITGNDARGTVTTGTGSPTSCTVNFAAAYATAPYCVITPVGGNPGAIQWWVTTTINTLVMNFSAAPTPSAQFSYYCMQ